jgi:hypothetical protein
MGDDTQKTTSTTGINNKALNQTITKLAGGISNLYQPGGTTYVAPSSTTTGAWGSSLAAANNPAYSGGIAGALQSYGNRAAGNELGVNDPLYAAQRARLTDDVMTNVNSTFTGSGRFGSGSHLESASRSLAEALGGLDLAQRTESYGRQAEAANMLPQLLAGGQLPSSYAASVGASMDADAAAKAGGQMDYLARLASIINGTAGAAGTTTTSTTQQDPLRLLLGGGLGLAALL